MIVLENADILIMMIMMIILIMLNATWIRRYLEKFSIDTKRSRHLYLAIKDIYLTIKDTLSPL